MNSLKTTMVGFLFTTVLGNIFTGQVGNILVIYNGRTGAPCATLPAGKSHARRGVSGRGSEYC